MMKKTIALFSTLLLFSCITVKENGYKTGITSSTTDSKLDHLDVERVRQALSDGVILNSDPYYADFATLILDLINHKEWEEISFLTDKVFYTNYVSYNNGESIDYCMFMLHTGEVGISTNYSLNEVESAYYTSSYVVDNTGIFEGIYAYPSGETEFFKILMTDTAEGLLISRE